jgi:hypothetical protein
MPEETKNTELALKSLVPDGSIEKFNEQDFAAVASGGGYLPRLQLMISQSEQVKKGEFTQNHYALVRDKKLQDVGSTVDVLVLAFRPKALQIGEQIISIYNPTNPEFKKIQELSDVKDSGCMFGPEYLLWIPSIKEFCTFFMGSKSARRESPNMQAILNKWKKGELGSPAASLKSHFIETPKYSWQAVTITGCSTPIEAPTVEAAKAQMEKFCNVKDSEIETVDPKDTNARAR